MQHCNIYHHVPAKLNQKSINSRLKVSFDPVLWSPKYSNTLFFVKSGVFNQKALINYPPPHIQRAIAPKSVANTNVQP